MVWTQTSVSVKTAAATPNRWDLVALPLVVGLLALAAVGGHQMAAPLASLDAPAVSLDPWNLPDYALRSTLRMLAAMAASLLFTFTYATLAAKSRRAGMVLIPVLDVLQSVPVLGYISFTVVFFLSLFPGSVLGAECAAIFAIFTSQAWNMTFSVYQSLRSVPRDLDEAATSFRFSGWQRFWRLEAPFAMPGLVWNMMMSMSGGWFFVVASEAITVGDHTVTLPGIGSYLAEAIAQKNLGAVGWAVLAMLAVILLYDQLLFRPLVAWADKFRVEQTGAQEAPESWVLRLFQRTRVCRSLLAPVVALLGRVAWLRLTPLSALSDALPPALKRRVAGPPSPARDRWLDRVWYAVVAAAALALGWTMLRFIAASAGWGDVGTVLLLGAATLLRVVVLIAIASLVWVPLGVLIGLRPRLAEAVQPLAQFLAAFPANLLFPVAVVTILRFDLNPDVWLSPLMILGTQWYILFNVIAGTSAFPSDLKEAASSFRIRGWQWWRDVMLPGVFPYYLTGAVTAAGGSWNASIVAEAVRWGDAEVTAHGLGSYIAQATAAGDYPRIVLGIAVMSLFVTLLNRLLWRPLYGYAERYLRLA
ncbi:ABC transporter permease subunit [Azospirillum brasilense]|uniref:ABC transporter permease subunit n=1 Tax=Azospirillum brasilense TaxID=192 RepID=A0A0P0F283_AZOBR|nr:MULTISPECIES: ABC transporter permease subunit [Azospirillum]ALJ34586.1 sulfonate ABC transporter permease [Azospirillum brasilense]MDW7554055.1 ABC transporter permease subunit [Azospirillum brasilense]MDW7592978.1 ABC transporter permease subunit [Azospirillum brasilense]MDW7593686.1 ABC transporter permease subunit [Azospirillum brasilense]MDW7627071.1 ABC transporter permease subunit [Azospirillum brasilense]